jgi:hypothetical protein
MTSPTRPRKPWLLVAGLVAAAALLVRGIMDWGTGGGWPLLLIAAALLFAVAARWVVYRE